MIPARLCLSNFMSYPAGSPVIDLSGFHIACLSGENGHGKSSLLDAITWALWGEARANNDSLVRVGQQEMWVDFEFDVDGIRYRVKRDHSMAKNSRTHTELQVVTEDGAYRSQSAQTETETQRKINALLRMDYTTFINSSFILQGRTDEFTRQKATRRKEILAKILDLERYDDLEEMARKRQRLTEDQATMLQREVEDLQREIARRPEYEEALEQSRQELEGSRAEVQELEQQLEKLNSEMSRLQAQLALLEALQAQQQTAIRSAAEARARAVQQTARLKTVESLLQQQAAIEARVRQLAEARKKLEAMEQAQKFYRDAESRETRLEAELVKKRHQIELRQATTEQKLKEHTQRAGAAQRLELEIAKLRHGHQPSAELHEQIEKLREELDGYKQQAQAAAAGIPLLADQMETIRQRLSLLQGPTASCPLCAHPLSEHDHQRLLSDMQGELCELQARCAEMEQEQASAEKEQTRIKKDGRQIQELQKAAAAAEQQIQKLEQSLQVAREAAESIPVVEAELSGIRAELAGEVDSKLMAQIQEARTARTASGYNQKEHEELRAQVRTHESAERDHERLKAAADSRADLAKQLEEAETQAKAHDKSASEAAAKIAPLASIPEQQKALTAILRDLQARRVATAQTASSAQEKVGRWTTLLEQCALAEIRQQEKNKERTAASKDAAVHKELAAAFSKKGIQAMIIENIIPEIEEEANRLLSRMTDNGMHIQFRTQKELKKGGAAETLDIIIGDEAGDRPYECYSGGEAFRIDFAIRIALSRLLASRAGARLQTIVIDEGFGTQDVHGRKRIVEAIESVKHEFARILVITHLDDMKDDFPTRIHVTKDAHGSRVEVLN